MGRTIENHPRLCDVLFQCPQRSINKFCKKSFSKSTLTYTPTLVTLINSHATQAKLFLVPPTTQANIKQITVNNWIDINTHK